MNITIDGPGGSGKSTVAKLIAKKLSVSYLDTGAMYRAIAYYALKKGVEPDDEPTVIALIENLEMKLWEENGVQQVSVNGENVTPFIREHNISMAASTISALGQVAADRSPSNPASTRIARPDNAVRNGPYASGSPMATISGR